MPLSRYAMSPQDALIAVMLVTSAASGEMLESERREIQSIVGLLPVFKAYDGSRLASLTETTLRHLENEDGLDSFVALVRKALPTHLFETAYALACDVAAADAKVGQPEMRFLEMLRHGLDIDRLNAAAIERGARARHMRA